MNELEREVESVFEEMAIGGYHPMHDLAHYAERVFDGKDLLITEAMDVMQEIGSVKRDENGLWWYDAGRWRPDGVDEIHRRVHRILGDAYKKRHSTELVDILKRRAPERPMKLDTRYVNVRNGLLDWCTGELHPHDPDIAVGPQIPVDWNPDATCPTFDRFASEVFPDDALDLVDEVMGYALYPAYPIHKVLALYGTGRNGKGTFIRLLTSLVGQENASAVSPQQLDERWFHVIQLRGKLLNTAGDVSANTFRKAEVFKKVTGGDAVTEGARRQDPVTFTSFALHVVAYNELPRSNDASEGFMSRWLVMPMERYFGGKPDPYLAEKLEADLPGILVRAVTGLRRLLVRGWFEEPPSVKAATDMFRQHADPVTSFLTEQTRDAPGGFLARPRMHDVYKAWCSYHGVAPLAPGKFHARVEAITSRSGKSQRSGVRGYLGMEWNPLADPVEGVVAGEYVAARREAKKQI